jgi:hypothetical protein
MAISRSGAQKVRGCAITFSWVLRIETACEIPLRKLQNGKVGSNRAESRRAFLRVTNDKARLGAAGDARRPICLCKRCRRVEYKKAADSHRPLRSAAVIAEMLRRHLRLEDAVLGEIGNAHVALPRKDETPRALSRSAAFQIGRPGRACATGRGTPIGKLLKRLHRLARELAPSYCAPSPLSGFGGTGSTGPGLRAFRSRAPA